MCRDVGGDQEAVGSQAEEIQAGIVGGRDAERGRREGPRRMGQDRVEKDEDPGRLNRTSSRAGLRIFFISFSTPKLFISILFKDFLNNNSKFVLM